MGTASLTAFNNLIAADPRYVIPGAPEQSALIDLLRGESEGAFTQMPVGGPSFLAMEQAGDTEITTAEVEDWISRLAAAPTGDDTAPTDGVLVRRLRAEQLVSALYQQLGLEESDFWSMEPSFGDYDAVGFGRSEEYPIRSPDAPPGWGTNSPVRQPSVERFHALGGPGFMSQVARSQDLSPAFLQALVQVSQAWCSKAVNKQNNAALFRDASLSDSSAQNAQANRDNIAFLHLKLLAEPATAEEVDELFSDIFQAFEPSGTDTAWPAVCATLIRDPRWVTY